MRLLTFFAVATWACLACAVQTHAGIDDAFLAASGDLALSTRNGAPEASAVITNLNMESAQ